MRITIGKKKEIREHVDKESKSEILNYWLLCCWIHSFIHSLQRLYSASWRGTMQKRSQPQHGQITQISVVERMFESGFREMIEAPRGGYSRLRGQPPKEHDFDFW